MISLAFTCQKTIINDIVFSSAINVYRLIGKKLRRKNIFEQSGFASLSSPPKSSMVFFYHPLAIVPNRSNIF